MPLSIQLPSPSSCAVEDYLSKGLSDAVGSLFSRSRSLPFSEVEIDSVAQDVQPIPVKWQTEIAIDDDAVFGTGSSSTTSSQLPPPPVRAGGWTGSRFFEAAAERLGLEPPLLPRLVERDDDIFQRFGSDIASLIKMKKIIKNELKDYDTAFKRETGREPSRSDKEPMRLLYTLYRKIRDLILKAEAASSVPAPSPQVVVAKVDAERLAMEDRLDALLEEKQSVRAVLQEYQTRFMQEQGRRIKYHRDIVAVDREYRQYKQLKEEIAKLEAQLGRRSSAANKTNDFFA